MPLELLDQLQLLAQRSTYQGTGVESLGIGEGTSEEGTVEQSSRPTHCGGEATWGGWIGVESLGIGSRGREGTVEQPPHPHVTVAGAKAGDVSSGGETGGGSTQAADIRWENRCSTDEVDEVDGKTNEVVQWGE